MTGEPIRTSRPDVFLTPVDTVDPRVRAAFSSVEGSRTTWLEICAPVDAFPQGLIDKLHASGWQYPQAHAFVPQPARITVSETDQNGSPQYQTRDLGYWEIEVLLVGPDPDSEWTADQAAAFTGSAREALRHYGFTKVPLRRASWQDLI